MKNFVYRSFILSIFCFDALSVSAETYVCHLDDIQSVIVNSDTEEVTLSDLFDVEQNVLFFEDSGDTIETKFKGYEDSGRYQLASTLFIDLTTEEDKGSHSLFHMEYMREDGVALDSKCYAMNRSVEL